MLMSDHGYASKRFPLTPMQGRVLLTMLRVFDSAGGRMARRTFTDRAFRMGYGRPETWTDGNCRMLLRLIEWAERRHGLHNFRNVRG